MSSVQLCLRDAPLLARHLTHQLVVGESEARTDGREHARVTNPLFNNAARELHEGGDLPRVAGVSSIVCVVEIPVANGENRRNLVRRNTRQNASHTGTGIRQLHRT